MRFLFYTHSLVSDWNHGNAHFLRGVLRELIAEGHAVEAYEPEGAWSLDNLLRTRIAICNLQCFYHISCDRL